MTLHKRFVDWVLIEINGRERDPFSSGSRFTYLINFSFPKNPETTKSQAVYANEVPRAEQVHLLFC